MKGQTTEPCINPAHEHHHDPRQSSAGDPLADWNGGGTINTQDFIAYLND